MKHFFLESQLSVANDMPLFVVADFTFSLRSAWALAAAVFTGAHLVPHHRNTSDRLYVFAGSTDHNKTYPGTTWRQPTDPGARRCGDTRTPSGPPTGRGASPGHPAADRTLPLWRCPGSARLSIETGNNPLPVGAILLPAYTRDLSGSNHFKVQPDSHPIQRLSAGGSIP